MADCLFCKIVAGEIPATIVKRTDDAVAFRDIDPRAPTHVLVIPTRHIPAVRDARGSESERALGHTLAFAAEVAGELGLDAGVGRTRRPHPPVRLGARGFVTWKLDVAFC